MHRLSILALLVPVLSAQTTSPDRGVNFYSIEKEQALGAQLSGEYRKRVTVIDNAVVTAYLNDLGHRVAANVAGQTYSYTFELVDTQADLLNEPVAFPGGHIFVSTQLILALKTEDELAGMLAHSIAHIAARHGTKQATRGQIMNQASIPLIMMGGWQGDAMRQNQALTVPLGFLKFQRQLELQADALAVPSMSAAGYNPQALADYIERVVQPAGDQLISHFPERDARVEAIRTAIEGLPPAAYPLHFGLGAIQDEVARLNVKPAKNPPRLAR